MTSKKNTWYLSLIVILASVCGCTDAYYTYGHSPVKPDARDFSLQLHSEKTKYKESEKIVINYILKNESHKKKKLIWHGSKSPGLSAVNLKTGRKYFYRYTQSTVPKAMAGRYGFVYYDEYKMQPKAEIRETIQFKTYVPPGKYTIIMKGHEIDELDYYAECRDTISVDSLDEYEIRNLYSNDKQTIHDLTFALAMQKDTSEVVRLLNNIFAIDPTLSTRPDFAAEKWMIDYDKKYSKP